MLAEAVLMAGTDTTRNQLACCVALFAEHPDQWALLAEQPELAARAVEETMRYLGAVRGTVRFASEDIVYRDVLFPRGRIVSIVAGRGQPGSRGLRAARTTSTSPPEREAGADDLRVGHPLLHGRRPGPGRAPGGVAPAGPAHARPGPRRRVEWKPSTFGIWGPARLPVRFDPSLSARRSGARAEPVLPARMLRLGQLPRWPLTHQLVLALAVGQGHRPGRPASAVPPPAWR